MGVVESKLLAENVLSACQRAENEGKTQLDSSSWNWKDKVPTPPSLFWLVP